MYIQFILNIKKIIGAHFYIFAEAKMFMSYHCSQVFVILQIVFILSEIYKNVYLHINLGLSYLQL